MIKPGLVRLAAGVFFLFSSGWCLAAGEATVNGKALFENNCGKCHSIDKPKAKKKSSDEWQATVLRMQKNGASITAGEAKLIAGYLAETYRK
jgi:mono/diheme cytochrome c family protein